MLASLADALEVRLDLALEFEALTPRAALEGVLDDIAAEFLLSALILHGINQSL
jgi:hypothetical protein